MSAFHPFQTRSAALVRSGRICTKRLRMELHGSTANNLTSAVRSARRLRGHEIHSDTLGHWRDLLDHARRELAVGSTEPTEALILELENQLADRTGSLSAFRPLRIVVRGRGPIKGLPSLIVTSALYCDAQNASLLCCPATNPCYAPLRQPRAWSLNCQAS